MLLPEQYNLLWRSSWLSGLTGAYAFYQNKCTAGMLIGNIFMTSLNFWRYPNDSWRRYVDMLSVQCCLLYQINKINLNTYGGIWMFLTSISITHFAKSCNNYRKQQFWPSTYNHRRLHILSNIANIFFIEGI